MREKAQALFRAQTQKAASYKRVLEEAQGAILQIPIKIDQDVPAGHEMDFGENLICDKIMFSKYSPLPKRLVKDCCPVGRRVIVRQRGFSTRIAVILSEKRNAVSLVDAGLDRKSTRLNSSS